ncbi:phosphoribosylanthranilate isomerase [Herbivorax sp. ANBcel31]|uniref:phosphoribosylanthranilate isomerase n=1 Tax=Herbivorax sp. ANBcel31 TaxID=3069754 RepID=UPI0027B4E52D|nr:phosphoribosylanthranilate isomerase [Herbivorax sp. ANBcel31]MDQ2086795.1 phosphoribosylanthranilate isomerase [Herbivorax sp. ANBcel31]
MTKVKICGLRREEDVEYVNRYLPEYIGFIFAKSRRRISIEFAGKLKKSLLPDIKTVGVFVNEDLLKVSETAYDLELDCIQLHGDETYEYVENLKKKLKEKKEIEVWKAIRVKDGDSIKKMSCYNVDAFVLDAYIEGIYGGVGKTFDWEIAKQAKKIGKIILAGGLNTGNISEAIKEVKPFAVDVSSGVETNKYKDEKKIKDFIESVKKD